VPGIDSLFERLRDSTIVNRDIYAETRALVALVKAQQLPFMAAALSYYAFLSVVPLLIVGLTVATTIAGEAVATRLLDSVGEFLTPEAATLAEEALVDAPGRGGVTAVGLLVLLWGSLRVFRGLDLAFSQVYGSTVPKPLPAQLRDALLGLGAVALAVGATAVAGVVLSRSPVPSAGLGGTLGLLVVLPPVFFPLYYVFPAADVGIREAIPGAVFAGIGWTALGTLFGIYASRAGSFELYGVLGGVLLLLVWFYFGALVLLVGTVLNAVLADRFADRQLQQEGLRQHSQRATMNADGPDDTDADGPDDTDADEPADKQRDTDGSAAGGASDADTPAGDATTGSDEAEETVTRAELADLRERLDEFEETLDERAVRPEELEAEIDEFEAEIDDRTVHRDEIERDLEQYVRRRVRRGHARGWGPYLVLLYGTAMTLGAFFLLGGGWAVLAMIIIWLSTLGLYALMLIVGATAGALKLPGRALDVVRNLR
jgi:membrane protein